MTACDEIRTELGGYALGALEPEEAERVAGHLARCDTCSRELEELSFAAELLRTPEAGTLARDADDVPAAEDALAAVAGERARERRRLRRATVAAGGAGALLLATAGIAISLAGRPVVDSSTRLGVPAVLRPATGVEASATVRLSPRPWGTQVDLVADRMPPLPAGTYYVLWLVRADDSKIAAGSFRPADPAGKARVRLAGSLPLGEVVRIGVTREGPGGSMPVLASDRT